jgi:hypothetical protein
MSNARAPQALSVPVLLLERHRRGELDPATDARVRAAVEADPLLRAELDALSADDDAVLRRHPPHEVARAVAARSAQAEAQARPAWIGGGVALLAAAMAAFVVLPRVLVPGSPPAEPSAQVEDTVAKGATGAHLIVFRKAADEAERLSDGAEAAEGDVLGLAYQSAKAAYGVIFSIDGRGTVTLHHPSPPEASSALATGGVVNLDQGYQLDDAPDFERFVLVTAGHPIDVQQVISAAESLSPAAAATARLPLPADLQQASLTLKKVR